MTKLTGLGISADHMAGDDYSRQSRIYSQMRQSNVGPTLLYVTPEKLSSSSNLLNSLTSLYNRSKLTMFVIDEVSSDWSIKFIALF